MRILPRSKSFIIISIFFFFMIGSEFYQGSLFSSLITTTPPQLPKCNQDVLDSDLDVITTGTTYGLGEGPTLDNSVVMDFMIPDVLQRIDGDTNLYKMLTNFKNKVIVVSTVNQFAFATNISDSLKFDYIRGEKKLKETFAILDNEEHVYNFVQGLQAKRKLWVKALDGLGLFYVHPVMMERSWLFPLFSQGLGRLCQSGFYQGWKNFDRLRGLFSYVKSKEKSELFRKSSLKMVSQVETREIIFDESNPVSVLALKNMLQLILMLILTGVCLFLIEWLTPARHEVHTLYIKVLKMLSNFQLFIFKLGKP
ncbi:Pyruvate dehydrogenase E1 component [Folsomia candida]|uniref:Pyruvate dehydrogenase E1 component n=1 Tax=Folsomia candida TaxID=158441 RepID=A0A226DWK7_FOLCA|nr:Pyruvate dehydrogenase E1 component [Folsomia candida]